MDRNDSTAPRVLVVIEGAEPRSDTLAQLSRVLGTDALELVGLFVEDEDLYRAIRLPVFKEVSLTGEVLEPDHDRVQRDIEGEHRRLSLNFETAVRALSYRCHIKIVRGYWLDTLSEAAKQSALVLVSRTDRAKGLRHRPVPAFQPLLTSVRNVLIVNEPWTSGRSVVLLGADPQALLTAHRMTQPEHLDLVVVLQTGSPVPEALPDGAIVVGVDDWSEGVVRRICQRWDARLLVARDDTWDPSMLVGLLDQLPCSLLRLG